MSGMREISERKANALNFLNPVLSTNQRPRFWALNQWEASISGPPILTHFQNQTAISAIKYHLSNQTAILAIRTQSPKSECNLSNQTALLLHCSLIVAIAVGLWRLQSPTRRWMTNCICKLRNFCSLIVEIVVGLWKLQLDCGDCSWIVEIAVTETP